MSRSLKIAVADDEDDIRHYMQWKLRRLGHEVFLAADGEQLVEVCRASAPDLVITDIGMPGLDGLAAAAAINRERPTPVIVVSAFLNTSRILTDARYLVACLHKPLVMAELQTAIEKATLCETREPVRDMPAVPDARNADKRLAELSAC